MQTSNPTETNPQASSIEPLRQNTAGEGIRIERIIYPLAILVAIFTWFFAIRYPLWLDETVSYWEVSGGFSQIWPRHGMFVAYPYVLWIAKSIFGSSVFALRLPSILAMLAATAILYRTAKEQFGYEAANIATVIFCIHPAVIFGAIDARPYAFAVLCLVIAIRYMLRWVATGSTRDGLIFGFASAAVLLFHLLFGIMLPAFALFLLIVKKWTPGKFRWTWAAALIPFALLCIPVVPMVIHLFQTRGVRVFTEKPTIDELALSFAPDFLLALFAVTMLLATATKRIASPTSEKPNAPSLAFVLGLVPLLSLFLISEFTPIHVFVGRYYLCAVPGLALCWGMMASWINCKWLRAVFCAALAAASMAINYSPTFMSSHGYTWKFAIDAAEANTAQDHAPILMCSGIVDSNAAVGRLEKTDGWLSPVNYYPLSSEVIGLPYSLTPVARREIDTFIQQAAQKKQRFLAMGFMPSYDSIRYMIEKSDGIYEARKVGIYDNIAVIEFRPK